jgi:glycosyltransferase involved in cell wall biosynthesis
MSHFSARRAMPGKIVLVGNYLPRQCGIATFTTDLLTALAQENPEGECWAMVMNDVPEGYRYPPEVRFEVNQRTLSDYRMAADFLNMSQVDMVCLQHEFGIFGGEDGSYILELISHLRMPVVTTLHTVLQVPSAGQFAILRKIAQVSDRLVVMSHKAKEILRTVYNVPGEKIVMIPHGIPDVPFLDPNYYKDQFGVEGRKVILTFGLLSPGKGIETMIDALPDVVRKHPDTVYIVLGATHPHVRREQGESYRLSLQRRARDLGVADQLIFHNRFVDLSELCEFLGASDLYVTPYLNREQIVSGTLAYALGTGKATISTPYWYAEEMLADGRGRLVPFRDPKALAEQVNELFDREVRRHAMRKRAYMFCRNMVWKEVARKYLELFAEVRRQREDRPRPVFRPSTLNAMPREMPQPKLDHLIRMTDDVGILQHAKFIVPDRHHGYCTDDNARALIAVLIAQQFLDESETLTRLACTYLGFLHYAYNEASGRFRNFMSYDRRWSEEVGSEDAHGRALWGLGTAVAQAEAAEIRALAASLFEKALPPVVEFSSPRAWAFALVGIEAYLRPFSGDSKVRRVASVLSEKLLELFRAHATEDWPWIEPSLAYVNGKIPQAMILSGRLLQQPEMLEAGLRCLRWLLAVQTDPKGHFVPVGNQGWYPRGGVKARFDQQPIEALGMIEACREAYQATGETSWIDAAQRCLDWFLGSNDLNVPLYDYRTGGCCDGLTANGPNLNQGAESTLAWLLSLMNLYQIRSARVSSVLPEEAGMDSPAF